MSKPRLAAQFEADKREQEAQLLSFIMGALIDASPQSGTLKAMVKMAANHDELERLERVLQVRDQARRGTLYLSMIGEIVCRSALDALEHIKC